MGAMRTPIFLLAQQAKQAFANEARNKAHDSIGTESQQRKAGAQKRPQMPSHQLQHVLHVIILKEKWGQYQPRWSISTPFKNESDRLSASSATKSSS